MESTSFWQIKSNSNNKSKTKWIPNLKKMSGHSSKWIGSWIRRWRYGNQKKYQDVISFGMLLLKHKQQFLCWQYLRRKLSHLNKCKARKLTSEKLHILAWILSELSILSDFIRQSKIVIKENIYCTLLFIAGFKRW